MPLDEKKKAVFACLRSERNDLFVEKKLTLSHFLEKQKICQLMKFLIFYTMSFEKTLKIKIAFLHTNILLVINIFVFIF